MPTIIMPRVVIMPTIIMPTHKHNAESSLILMPTIIITIMIIYFNAVKLLCLCWDWNLHESEFTRIGVLRESYFTRITVLMCTVYWWMKLNNLLMKFAVWLYSYEFGLLYIFAWITITLGLGICTNNCRTLHDFLS